MCERFQLCIKPISFLVLNLYIFIEYDIILTKITSSSTQIIKLTLYKIKRLVKREREVTDKPETVSAQFISLRENVQDTLNNHNEHLVDSSFHSEYKVQHVSTTTIVTVSSW